MVGKRLMILCLLVGFNKVTPQPTVREAGELGPIECCPCPKPTMARAHERSRYDMHSAECPYRPRADDAEPSASILLPALRAMQPFVKPSDQQSDPKPLLQPEVGLASSVLETLRQATDEEYQEALARDAARSAVKLIESTFDSPDDSLFGSPKNKVSIFPNIKDDMHDNLSAPSHIQETRCIHSPLESIYKNDQWKKSPTSIEENDLSFKPTKKLKNKSNHNRKFRDMDNAETSNENPSISQMNLKNLDDDCNSQEFYSKKTNFITDHKSSIEKGDEINSMQPILSEADNNFAVNGAHNMLPNSSEDPSQVSYTDLQNMSNDILSLSECEVTNEKNEFSKSNNLNEDLDEINDYYEIPNMTLPTPVFETNSKKTEEAPDTVSSLNGKTQIHEVSSDINPNEKLYDERETDTKNYYSSVEENTEMQAEASVLEPTTHLLPNVVENDKKSKIITKASEGVNNFTKYSNFLNNLRSKLGTMFSTTEKVSECLNIPNDNTDESSNINPMVAKFDKLENLKKVQRMPQTLLQETSLPKLSGLSINSNKNRLATQNFIKQPLTGNSPNFLNFPLEKSRPFNDPSLSLNLLSDKLRSHAENTIQNVKETLESTLKDSQNIHLYRPTETIDTLDILQAMSNRRDEMKEKLQAIHLDFNDRFNSFQQNVLDHFNDPSDENTEFQKQNRNTRLRNNYIPKTKELPYSEPSKFRSANLDYNFMPYPDSPSKDGISTERNSLLPLKKPVAPSRVRLSNSDRKTPVHNVLLSTTTAIPFFIPRLKTLKTNVGSTPRQTSETLSKARLSKIPKLSNEKLTKINPLLLKPKLTNTRLEEPHSSFSTPSQVNMPMNSFKTNAGKINRDHSSIDFPVNKLKNVLLKKHENRNTPKGFTRSQLDPITSKSLNDKDISNTKEDPFLSRMKQGESRSNDDLIISSTSYRDTVHPPQKEMDFRLVEPMKENVPYKCKLICYKDS